MMETMSGFIEIVVAVRIIVSAEDLVKVNIARNFVGSEFILRTLFASSSVVLFSDRPQY
jgi:hypothetical protein